jgi:hypothetical protein
MLLAGIQTRATVELLCVAGDSRQKHAGMTNVISDTYLRRPVLRVLASSQMPASLS